MNLLNALKECKNKGRACWRQSWRAHDGVSDSWIPPDYDYTIPAYIFYNTREEAFCAFFGRVSPGVDVPIVEEDLQNSVVVSNFSVQDILAEDWVVGYTLPKEDARRLRLAELDQKIQNITATYDEIQEYLRLSKELKTE